MDTRGVNSFVGIKSIRGMKWNDDSAVLVITEELALTLLKSDSISTFLAAIAEVKTQSKNAKNIVLI